MSDKTLKTINIICIIISAVTIITLAAKVILIHVYVIPFYMVIGPGAVLNIILAYRNKKRYDRHYEIFALLALIFAVVFIWLVLR